MDAKRPTRPADSRQQTIDAPNRDAVRQEAKAAMHNTTIHQRNERRVHTGPAASARKRSRIARPGPVRRSQPRRRRWALVQVWDGAVLATFDDEARAREVLGRTDDDEVVLLSVGP